MLTCDRRTFVQTAALGSLLTSVLAASSAEAAAQAGYFVIAEVVAKPGSATSFAAGACCVEAVHAGRKRDDDLERLGGLRARRTGGGCEQCCGGTAEHDVTACCA